MDVEHDHRNQDWESHQDHCEQEILANKRNYQGSGGYKLSQEKKKYCQREKDTGAKSNFFPTVRRQVECENSQKWDANTRNDKVDWVEEGFTADGDVESDIRIGLWTTGVSFYVAPGWDWHDVPLDTAVVVAEVDAYRDVVACIGFLIYVD